MSEKVCNLEYLSVAKINPFSANATLLAKPRSGMSVVANEYTLYQRPRLWIATKRGKTQIENCAFIAMQHFKARHPSVVAECISLVSFTG